MPPEDVPTLTVRRDQVPRPPTGIRYFHAITVDDDALPQGSELERLARGFLRRYAVEAGGRIIPGTTREQIVLRSPLRRRLYVHVLEAEHDQPRPDLIRVRTFFPYLLPPPERTFPATCLSCGHTAPPTCTCRRPARL